MKEQLINVENLSYSIAEKQIIDAINLHILNKEFVGLIGPNGSGKTTILRHIYRTLKPDFGNIYINGQHIDNFTSKQLSQDIAVVRQENATPFDFTVIEMVLFGRYPYKKRFEDFNKEDNKIAFHALDQVGMKDYGKRYYLTLSGGEKQRVLIARSLAQETEILLLDEFTNHLDVYYQWSLMDIIKNLDKTVLAVFHELNLACSYCDYIYLLKEGKIYKGGTPNEVCTSKNLKEIFGIESEIIYNKHHKPYIVYSGAATNE